MVAEVVEHIAHGIGDFPARAEHVRVVAIDEDAARAPGQRIEPPGDADAEALHAARQGAGVRRLDDQVQVSALDRVVDDPQAKAQLGIAEGLRQHCCPPRTAQIADARAHPQGDVHGMPGSERGPAQVRHLEATKAGTRVLARTSGPRAAAAPPGQIESKLRGHLS